MLLGKEPQTDYYTEKNGKVIKDSISLEGNDWTYSQHRKIDTQAKKEDFEKVCKEYLSWRVSNAIKNGDSLGK